MTFYKIVKDNTFIGVANSNNFIRYQKKHNIILLCDVDKAQYLMCENGIYHDLWMCAENPENKGKYENATVTEITEDEYNSLYESEPFEIVDEPEPEPQPITNNPIDDVTVDFLIDKKIIAMKKACENAITNGFDVIVKGENKHFSLTIQDQLNLITLSAMAENNVENIPYHADNEKCEYYTADEIKAIIAAATAFKAYHTTYFNSLKGYIQSLETMADVTAVYYGIAIPDDFKSDVLKDLENE